MKQLKLTSGQSTMVDEDVYEIVNCYKWRSDSLAGHVVRTVGTKNGRRLVRLHRLIMNAQTGQIVDHIDGNVLNNTRANLRLADKSTNGMNRLKQRNNKSGYKGVCKHSQCNRWVAQIKAGPVKWQGLYKTAIEAARAYDVKAMEMHGEFAILNFPKTNNSRGLEDLC